MEGGREHRVLGSPLAVFARNGWRRWSQEIVGLQVNCDEFILCLVWTLDMLKEQDEGTNAMFRDRVYDGLREHFIAKQFKSSREDLNYLTNLVCACSLACLGLALKDERDNQEVYCELVAGFGGHWEEIRKLKHCADMDVGVDGLQGWMKDYWRCEGFFTFRDRVEWDIKNEDKMLHRTDKISKVDLFRVIMALEKIGAFESPDGEPADVKEVFQAFGDMLDDDYSGYARDLNSGSNRKTEVTIFKKLEKAFLKSEDDKLDRVNRR